MSDTRNLMRSFIALTGEEVVNQGNFNPKYVRFLENNILDSINSGKDTCATCEFAKSRGKLLVCEKITNQSDADTQLAEIVSFQTGARFLVNPNFGCKLYVEKKNSLQKI